jgi:hypothetical protein
MREKVRHYSLKEPGRQQMDILSDAQVRLMIRTGEKIGNPDYHVERGGRRWVRVGQIPVWQ